MTIFTTISSTFSATNGKKPYVLSAHVEYSVES